MQLTVRTFLLSTSLLVSASIASAISVTAPEFDSFGSLPAANFGGSGIPNDSVAITTINAGGKNYVLGLTAHQRYSNPALENDGAGNFWALAGGDTAHGQPDYAMWNLGFYSNIKPASGYTLRLFYDRDPAEGNDLTKFFDVPGGLFTPTGSQGSYNLGMWSWSGLNILAGSFDPSAHGEYSFALALFQGETELGRSAIIVNVNGTGTKPPAPAVPDASTTVTLLGGALIGLAAVSRRRRA